jgi:hypothetical protein
MWNTWHLPKTWYLLNYLLTHSTEQCHSWQARNSPNYMEPDGSLPRFQVPATWAYHKPDQSSQTLLTTPEIFAHHNKSMSLIRLQCHKIGPFVLSGLKCLEFICQFLETFHYSPSTKSLHTHSFAQIYRYVHTILPYERMMELLEPCSSKDPNVHTVVPTRFLL